MVFSANQCIKGIDHQQTILRLFHKCITSMSSSLFLINCLPEFIESLDTRQMTIHEIPWTACTDWLTDWLSTYNFFVDSLRIYNVMSWINFILIFSSGLELFSPFNFHRPVHRCLIHVFFIWLYNLSPLLLSIALACPVRLQLTTPSSGEKVSRTVKKNYLKNRQQSFIGDAY